MAVRYAIRFESSAGSWTDDSELGPRRSVAVEEIDNLARQAAEKISNGHSEWAHITLIVEATN